MWMGYHYHLAGFIRADGTKVGKQDNLARSCAWFTNMPVKYRNNFMMLDEEYSSDAYPKYDNYDAIHVELTKSIPCDYDGKMGVPITFLQKYCPEQFTIIGLTCTAETMDKPVQLGDAFMKKYKEQGGTGHFSSNMYGVCYYDNDGKAKVPFARIIIKKK